MLCTPWPARESKCPNRGSLICEVRPASAWGACSIESGKHVAAVKERYSEDKARGPVTARAGQGGKRKITGAKQSVAVVNVQGDRSAGAVCAGVSHHHALGRAGTVISRRIARRKAG